MLKFPCRKVVWEPARTIDHERPEAVEVKEQRTRECCRVRCVPGTGKRVQPKAGGNHTGRDDDELKQAVSTLGLFDYFDLVART